MFYHTVKIKPLRSTTPHNHNLTEVIYMELSGIRKARKKAGLTQNQLADILGMSRATLSKYEGGQISPSIDQLSKIAIALNTTVAEMLGNDSSGVDFSEHINHRKEGTGINMEPKKTLDFLLGLKKESNKMMVKNVLDYDGSFGNSFLIGDAINAAAAEDALWCAEQVYKDSVEFQNGSHHEEINPEYTIRFLFGYITSYCHRHYGDGIEAIHKGKQDDFSKVVLDAVRCVKIAYKLSDK